MFALIIEILGLAVTAWSQLATGGAKNTATLADTLVKIAQKASEAYTAHTGEPINPDLLKPIQPLP